MVKSEDLILDDGMLNRRRLGKAPSGAGHGGKRKGAGRPRSPSFNWSGPRRTFSAPLLRKYADEAVRSLGACPSNRKSPSPAKQNSHWGKLR
jgi:hypothetical protein